MEKVFKHSLWLLVILLMACGAGQGGETAQGHVSVITTAGVPSLPDAITVYHWERKPWGGIVFQIPRDLAEQGYVLVDEAGIVLSSLVETATEEPVNWFVSEDVKDPILVGPGGTYKINLEIGQESIISQAPVVFTGIIFRDEEFLNIRIHFDQRRDIAGLISHPINFNVGIGVDGGNRLDFNRIPIEISEYEVANRVDLFHFRDNHPDSGKPYITDFQYQVSWPTLVD